MHRRFTHIAVLVVTVFFFSCKNMPTQSHGPIVLGDSSVIVTETDPQKLQDLVTDLKPAIQTAEVKDTAMPFSHNAAVAGKVPDTIKKAAVAEVYKPQPAAAVAGLKTDFTEVSVVIPNLEAKLAGNQNLLHANGAVYTLVSGVIDGSLLKVSGNVTKVSQRYQSVVVLKNETGELPLESLSTTTPWEPLKGANNIYRISGLDERSLEVPDANRNTIRNAVAKAAQRRRMNRRRVQEWENSARNLRAANQKPLYIMLRSVMWKIDGKDAQGKIFSKQIRVDVPM